MMFVNVFILLISTPATKKQPDIKAALKCSYLLFSLQCYLTARVFKPITANYSTVTDLAKLRGWSTSVPLIMAT